jgi:hypothetical protein
MRGGTLPVGVMADKKGVLLHREVGVVESLKIHVEQKKVRGGLPR